MKFVVSTLLAGGLFAGAIAMAQGTVNQRQENQKDRIKAGVKDGSLTTKEAAKLAGQQKSIRAQERRDRIDGPGYTAKEKARTQKRLNNASESISKQKHDAQTK